MRYFYYILIGLSLVSCQKEIPFKGAGTDPEMVLNGALIAGAFPEVNISQNRSILDDANSYTPIQQATVTLLNVSDQTTEVLTHSIAGTYTSSNITIEEGKEYQITVEDNNFPSVTASQTIPSATTIINMDTSTTIHFLEPYFDLYLEFEDNPTEENYYEIEVIGSFYQYFKDTITFELDSALVYEPMPFQSFDPIFGNKSFGGQRLLFSDTELPASRYTLNLSLETYLTVLGGTISIRLANVSRDYYLYYISRATQSEKGILPNSEPVPVYSNTSNGFGIFGSLNAVRDSIQLPPR